MLDRLRSSALDMACRCPEQFRRAYVEGEAIPPSIAMVRGTAVHRGAEMNFRQKVETKKDLSAEEIVEEAVDHFAGLCVQGDIKWDELDDRSGSGIKQAIGTAKDQVVRSVGVYSADVAPLYHPTHVEQSIVISVDNGLPVTGTIDVIDRTGVIADFKTRGKKQSVDEAGKSLQLTVYAAGYRSHFGTDPIAVNMECIVTTKTKSYRQSLTSFRGPKQYASLIAIYRTVNKMMETGSFPPNTAGWWCSPKYCGYYGTCAYPVKVYGIEKGIK